MAGCHPLGPLGLFGPMPRVEVLQTPDMVRFDVSVLLAEFTGRVNLIWPHRDGFIWPHLERSFDRVTV